jgi:hypothetical protein
VCLAVVLAVGCGDEKKAKSTSKAQTVRFQEPTSNGPDPFTKPADVRGEQKVAVGSGPFGGTGSDLVCDRELLIRSLRARPDRLREWARVLSVEPTEAKVASYIRGLRPVTLTRDTRVTNHSFVGSRAAGYQAILQAGTAVLVDSRGIPVARCRCGNPLLEPIFIRTARCLGCPPRYKPPPPCDPFSECFRRYPKPPPVKRGHRRSAPSEPQQPAEPSRSPSASFSPSSGQAGDSFTLSASGFASNRTLDVTLTRPDGVVERYSISTGSDGSGSHVFPGGDPNVVTGTYTAVVTDPGSGDSASASVSVSAADAGSTQTLDQSGELQCDPPRSQLESEQCAAAGR